MLNTRYMATEEAIRKQHPEATAVEGSRIEQIVLDQPEELLAAMPNSQKPDLSILIWPCTIPERDGRIPLKGSPGNYTVSQEGDDWWYCSTTSFPCTAGLGLFVSRRHHDYILPLELPHLALHATLED